ncbi:APO protein 4, mitochondrial isoform X2 [Euphorbia lathyris]|uniref:APO protein 4, mitochondrial isoform X2 n=1 Tax=Euphorbia lathyris TaxID=212925 RepID=UPI0033141EDB
MSKKILQNLSGDYNRYTMHFRSYSTRNDWKKLRPMILKRIENREKDYPVQNMVPIANEVLKARMLLIQGISTLIQTIPILSCKFCPEVYIGEKGHLIQTCWGYRRGPKNRVHQWNAVELCRQAGADLSMENGYSGTTVFTVNDEAEMLSGDLNFVANGTLRAWETLRSGVKKLLFVYPSKVCKYCSEIHVGPSGHKARLCGIFKYENWRGSHFWRKAGVDDLVPPKIVWRQRPQDPSVLLDKGRDFYGHAPAVVDLCTKAGAIAPTKYHTMMKIHGLPGPV